MLKIKHLYKTFNPNSVNEKRALWDLNLTLNEGDFVTIIGGNGAGKSTMLNAIRGVWKPDSGKIIIGGVDVTGMPEHKRARFLGRVFQDPMLGTAANMSIQENMALALRRGNRRGLSWGITEKEKVQFRAALQTLDLGLETRMTSKVGLLSGGQRQAVTLLMATLKKPKLLLLDEHTAALDPKTAAKVLELSEKIVAENHLTALMVTHNMKDAIRLGNRLIMMYNGKIIYDTACEDQPINTYALLPEVVTAINGNDVFTWHYRDGRMESHAAIPIYSFGALTGCVYLTDKDEAQGALIATLEKNILNCYNIG